MGQRSDATVAEVAAAMLICCSQAGVGCLGGKARFIRPRSITAGSRKGPDTIPTPSENTLLAGGDVIDVFVRRCHERRQAPFISYRLNDGHFHETAGTKRPGVELVSRFYTEHPEYRIGSRATWDDWVLNWGIPAVRDYNFSFIQDICENYDIAGLELDFMRHISYFRIAETTSAERSRIMTGFIARTRKLLNETTRGGKHRWLCARVPCYLRDHDKLGIDLAAMVDAGLEMVNLSGYFRTIIQNDFGEIRKLIPSPALYQELTQCTWTKRQTGIYDSYLYLRTTDEQFYTGANLAYARGGDGVSLFNFVTTASTAVRAGGPFNEPPFHVLKRSFERPRVVGQAAAMVFVSAAGSKRRSTYRT